MELLEWEPPAPVLAMQGMDKHFDMTENMELARSENMERVENIQLAKARRENPTMDIHSDRVN